MITHALKQPTRKRWSGRPASLFGLASDGACQARHVTIPTGGLLLHRFTLTNLKKMAVSFLWRFPEITPPGRYPASCPMKPGLSSPFPTDYSLKRGDSPPDSRKRKLFFCLCRLFLRHIRRFSIEMLNPIN